MGPTLFQLFARKRAEYEESAYSEGRGLAAVDPAGSPPSYLTDSTPQDKQRKPSRWVSKLGNSATTSPRRGSSQLFFSTQLKRPPNARNPCRIGWPQRGHPGGVAVFAHIAARNGARVKVTLPPSAVFAHHRNQHR